MHRAKHFMYVATLMLSAPEYEEDNITLNGFFVQQSLELCLKHVLELNGEKTMFTHDIGKLLTAVERTANPFPFREETMGNLLMMSGTITAWESKTRYVKGMLLERRLVEMAMGLVKEVIDELDGYKEGGVGNNGIKKLDLQ